MKKRIQVKTSKRQVIYLIIELFFLIVFPSIVLCFTDNDIVLIITLAISLTMGIWMCVLCVKDGKVRYKEALAIEEESDSFNQKFEQFMDVIRCFDYQEATDEDKKKYLVYYLYTSCSIESPISFYQRTKMFKKTEIKRIIKQINFSKDFMDFFKNVLEYKMITPSIFRFEYEMIDLINVLSQQKEEKDPLIEDSNVLYDYTKHFRCRVIKDDCYYVEKATLVQHRDYWQTIIEDITYSTYEEAYQRCQELIKQVQHGFNVNDFFSPKRYCKEDYCWDYMIDDYDLGYLDEPLNTLCSYYVLTRRYGHLWISQNILDKEYFERIKEYLKPELFDLLIEINEKKKSIRLKSICKKADELYQDNESKIQKVLRELAIEEYQKRIKDKDII